VNAFLRTIVSISAKK